MHTMPSFMQNFSTFQVFFYKEGNPTNSVGLWVHAALCRHAGRDNELSSSGNCALASGGCIGCGLAEQNGRVGHALVYRQCVVHVCSLAVCAIENP